MARFVRIAGIIGETTLLQGMSHRPGMYQCKACRKPFWVKVGTVREKSRIALHKWAPGFHLCASLEKGLSAINSTGPSALPTRPLGSW